MIPSSLRPICQKKEKSKFRLVASYDVMDQRPLTDRHEKVPVLDVCAPCETLLIVRVTREGGRSHRRLTRALKPFPFQTLLLFVLKTELSSTCERVSFFSSSSSRPFFFPCFSLIRSSSLSVFFPLFLSNTRVPQSFPSFSLLFS